MQANIVTGTPDPEVLRGTTADDLINGFAGSDLIIGNGGTDVLLGGTGPDLLVGDNLEAQFVSPEISAGIPRKIFTAYAAALGREPDVAGFDIRLEAATARDLRDPNFSGASYGLNVYLSLSRSPEGIAYQQSIEAQTQNYSAFYKIIGREPGDSYVPALDALLVSPELQNRIEPGYTAFVENTNSANWIDNVFRLYQTTLDRVPDKQGLLDWADRLADGATLETVIIGFTASTEFQQTYGTLEDAAFLTLMYSNVLDRAPDTAGQEGWLDALVQGATRADIVRGFSESRELIAKGAAPLKAWVLAQGTDDTLDGGANSVGDTLAGGSLSDTFIFHPTSTEVSVLDLEPWDKLSFEQFGYTSVDEVMGNFAENFGQTTYVDNDVLIYLRGTALDEITSDMILI